MKLALKCILLLLPCHSMAQHLENLYQGDIPNYTAGKNAQETNLLNGIERVSKVSIPSYSYFKAPGDGPKPCVIICPGGAYTILASAHEGRAIAEQFNKNGINALLLYYRLPDSTA